jgi:hypothetical protein
MLSGLVLSFIDVRAVFGQPFRPRKRSDVGQITSDAAEIITN